ncbi:alpha/beta fold hydrolase [Angelakisella massiliensis]|uniref:alpha/beta fold hydrolase n=1 Tax=Angelakisella massiliensis TaxID=1871018 RepID=UPI0024B1DC40|nr:alpha/beta fold hydrolase [Angelakisella massiliensis]
MSIREISFPSANGRDTVKAWAYTPLGKPRGVIQLIHGYGEHSRRYLHMIGKFQAAGFVVYADDHIGHGKTGYDGGTLGDPHSGGYETYLKDEKQLHDIAAADYPALPYLMFGHSWGSMLARAYAACYGEDLTALMLCGLCSQWKGCEEAYENEEFRAVYEADPYQPAGPWFGRVFSGMTDRIANPNGPSDWIANDPRVVADHGSDMFNTFDTTLELVWDFVQLYHFIENPQWAEKVPSRLPVYLISGDQDPCGNYGEGLYHVANLLARSGNPVSVKAYSGYRHEIHNEPELRDEVEEGLIRFLDGVLS